MLKQASLITWDEVAMTKRQAVEMLDRLLKDIMECPLPFGGKVVVFGGDFRQVLPVVTRGTRAQITDHGCYTFEILFVGEDPQDTPHA